MTIDNSITEGIEELFNRSADLAIQSLRSNDRKKANVLFGIADQLQALLPPNNDHSPNVDVSAAHAASESAMSTEERNNLQLRRPYVEVFAMRAGERHEAELDVKRISNGGQGSCIKFRGDWMTVSKAANIITGTQVNGWQNFWRYRRDDGTDTTGPIQELRERELRSRNSSRTL